MTHESYQILHFSFEKLINQRLLFYFIKLYYWGYLLIFLNYKEKR